ncbi:Uu.00g032730.m01.CDS01 [Anthostomella pinea]|uniref:Uu.00g032730.m01.CDS01 n=1 Tax=Anthostomella pinea TaxID=933095 RepID=A0AAI8V8R5_9PEZI|nr:Uu.00g032730.m01.CDS01 [Anthostomella pinea]
MPQRSKCDDNRFSPGFIMGVSKEVQREAEYIFWGKSQFIFPLGSISDPLCMDVSHLCYGSPKKVSLAKDLSYAFDMRDVEIDPHEAREHVLGLAVWDPEEALHAIHEYQRDKLMDGWIDRIEQLRADTSPRRLQVDLVDCYCPLGCCRIAGTVCSINLLLGEYIQLPWLPGRLRLLERSPQAALANIRHVELVLENNIHPHDLNLPPPHYFRAVIQMLKFSLPLKHLLIRFGVTPPDMRKDPWDMSPIHENQPVLHGGWIEQILRLSGLQRVALSLYFHPIRLDNLNNLELVARICFFFKTLRDGLLETARSLDTTTFGSLPPTPNQSLWASTDMLRLSATMIMDELAWDREDEPCGDSEGLTAGPDDHTIET